MSVIFLQSVTQWVTFPGKLGAVMSGVMGNGGKSTEPCEFYDIVMVARAQPVDWDELGMAWDELGMAWDELGMEKSLPAGYICWKKWAR